MLTAAVAVVQVSGCWKAVSVTIRNFASLYSGGAAVCRRSSLQEGGACGRQRASKHVNRNPFRITNRSPCFTPGFHSG